MRDAYASEKRCHIVAKQPSAKKKEQEPCVQTFCRAKTGYSLQEKRRHIVPSNCGSTNSGADDWPVHSESDITNFKRKLIQAVTR